ncbi:hypothetical protein MCOR27_003508 [Pyricularia oryzae]|uniref:Uncharacterized protein n=1 Tax=Pyricularia grisea TaxID=148305 RepID=A0ABQ8NL73_PYRGI|nr:hypothetical protein MCOR01_006842 [Pyricularia oryzae]KAI6298786.1 hypothetical protein MCOR33_005171 [Pyricularia grisea]KAH9434602.1 hypothetical protein MCOR02_006597 [Pyricularia oryzae]KAI6261163.1 hypothetical protein MCOR19_002586 [Pyricularia oryzae]KAI6275978.1 hypothetical protein MCOR26_005818 [Pyricularia oryzae]
MATAGKSFEGLESTATPRQATSTKTENTLRRYAAGAYETRLETTARPRRMVATCMRNRSRRHKVTPTDHCLGPHLVLLARLRSSFDLSIGGADTTISTFMQQATVNNLFKACSLCLGHASHCLSNDLVAAV